MQISDKLGQYNRNTNQSVSIAAPTPGVQQLVKTVREMTVGNVFEGTVNEIKKGQVILGLSNGETVAAKIAGNVTLSLGQSMFFQVKSNNGMQIEIRPYTNGNLSNPTLLKALDAAGIPASGRTIDMVNSMMEEQMPIDRQSLWNMAKTVADQPEVNVSTIVQMKKLDIPITPELAGQFENYKADRAAITDQMNTLMKDLSDVFSGNMLTEKEAWNLNSRILDILTAGLSSEEAMVTADTEIPVNLDAEILKPENTVSDNMAKSGTGVDVLITEDTLFTLAQSNMEQSTMTEVEYPEHSVGGELTASQLKGLQQQLGDFPQLLQNTKLFTADGSLHPGLSIRELLVNMQKALQDEDFTDTASVKKLLSSKPYQVLLRDVMEQEWMIKPEDLQEENKISDLYQKLDRQMDRLEEVLRQTGQDGTNLARATADVRGNIEFMNQINQICHYIQIPLKMSGQNVHSDLYVYTNKKNLQEPEGDLTAFLHLDMEHLGSTDVSVRMHNRKVQTEFYLADDKSYEVIMEHVGILQERLERKGYACMVHVNNQEKRVNLVDDILKRDQPAAGRVHRYSFDVRA